MKVNKFFFFFGISIKAKPNMIIRLSNVVCFDFARSTTLQSVSGLYVASHYVFTRRKYGAPLYFWEIVFFSDIVFYIHNFILENNFIPTC